MASASSHGSSLSVPQSTPSRESSTSLGGPIKLSWHGVVEAELNCTKRYVRKQLSGSLGLMPISRAVSVASAVVETIRDGGLGLMFEPHQLEWMMEVLRFCTSLPQGAHDSVHSEARVVLQRWLCSGIPCSALPASCTIPFRQECLLLLTRPLDAVGQDNSAKVLDAISVYVQGVQRCQSDEDEEIFRATAVVMIGCGCVAAKRADTGLLEDLLSLVFEFLIRGCPSSASTWSLLQGFMEQISGQRQAVLSWAGFCLVLAKRVCRQLYGPTEGSPSILLNRYIAASGKIKNDEDLDAPCNEAICLLWRCMHLFGDPNNGNVNRMCQAPVIQGFSDVILLFQKVGRHLPPAQRGTAHPRTPAPPNADSLLRLCGDFMLVAVAQNVKLTGEQHAQQITVTAGCTLLRILAGSSRRPISQQMLARLYTIVTMLTADEVPDSTIASLLPDLTLILKNDVKGKLIIAPSIFSAAKRVLLDNQGRFNADSLNDAMLLLLAINGLYATHNPSELKSVTDLATQLTSLHSDQRVASQAAWLIYTSALHCSHDRPEEAIEYIDRLRSLCTQLGHVCAFSAVEALACCKDWIPYRLLKTRPSIAADCVSTLVDSTLAVLKSGKTSAELITTATSACYAASDWLAQVPSIALNDHVACSVISVFEASKSSSTFGLTVSSPTRDRPASMTASQPISIEAARLRSGSDAPAALVHSSPSQALRKSVSTMPNSRSSLSRSSAEEEAPSPGSESTGEGDASGKWNASRYGGGSGSKKSVETVQIEFKEACVFLCHTAVFLCSYFPSKHGPSTYSTRLQEIDFAPEDVDRTTDAVYEKLVERCRLYLLNNTGTLSTISSVGGMVHTIFRDEAGRYAWKWELVDSGDGKKATEKELPVVQPGAVSRLTGISEDSEIEEETVSSNKETPCGLRLLLHGSTSEEVDMPNVCFGTRDESLERILQLELEKRNVIFAGESHEDQESKIRSRSKSRGRRAASMYVHGAQARQATQRWDGLLLAHLGLLGHTRNPCVHPTVAGSKLWRTIGSLDKTFERETHKVGLIYVANHMQTQREILHACSGTEDYEGFVGGIGWKVPMAMHKGFMGGLDARGTTGATAPYFADNTMEMMMHVPTMMPTVPSGKDSQQITKKRHVGNDHVHIIWNEDIHPYRTNTITSQFNDVHIVLHPTDGGLLSTHLHVKDEEKSGIIGPLRTGCLIRRRDAAMLVRDTAVTANRRVRAKQDGYRRPQPTRRTLLSEIEKRYRNSMEDDELISSVIS